jgi:Arc/MetJ-type ribon-helix-helix transcriptional regulator
MRRLTISVDDDLADTFDRLVPEKGYGSRSEAFRDFVRGALGSAQLDAGTAKHCVGALSYVYNHHERQLASRLTGMQHDHHDWHFGESPLVEDNSAKSPAYTTVDLQLGYQKLGHWLLAVDIFNLAGVKWNDIEYYYVSRLQNEGSPSPDFVVHPGVPRTVRAHFQYFL